MGDIIDMDNSGTVPEAGQKRTRQQQDAVVCDIKKGDQPMSFPEEETEKAMEIAHKLKIPFVNPLTARIESSALALVTKEMSLQLQALPVRIVEDIVLVALVSPENPMVVRTLEMATGSKVRPAAAPKSALLATIKRAHAQAGDLDSSLFETAPPDTGKTQLEDENRAVTISIISNKGGVGKTHVAINLSCALVKGGKKVLLIDADLGNADVSNKLALFPENHLMHFFQKKRQMDELIVSTKFGFDLICGTYGEFKLANVNYAQKMRFINHFKKVSQRYDFAVFDLGAGIARTVLDFALGAERTVIVTTPQDIISGYACAKAAFFRFKEIEERLEEKGQDYLPQWIFSPLFIINQAATPDMGFKLFGHIEKTANEQINRDESRFRIEPEYLGSIEYDKKNVRTSESKKLPLLTHAPNLKVSQSILHMASRFSVPDQSFVPRIKYMHPLKRFMAILSEKK